MNLTVNGSPVQVQMGITLQKFLEQTGYQTGRIAVEKNGEIISKTRYGEQVLLDGDRLEIVTFVGGG